MYENIINRLSQMSRVLGAAFGALAGAIVGAIVEFAKWSRDNHRRLNRRLEKIQTQIDHIKDSLGISGAGAYSTVYDKSPVALGPYTADITSGATWLFGSSNAVSSSAAAAGGVPTGRTARKFSQLVVHNDTALGSGASLVCTPQFSTDGTTWNALGSATVALSTNAAAGTYSGNLVADGSDVSIPADALVRVQVSATGDPASGIYTFYLR